MPKGFNPRPYTRGDLVAELRRCGYAGFNPRLYTRGDHISPVEQLTISTFQSTPLHEGRRYYWLERTLLRVVSIHTPTRGATLTKLDAPELFKFQSTPLREGRHCLHPNLICHHCFNPRPYTRGDPGTLARAPIRRFQSTPLCEGRRRSVLLLKWQFAQIFVKVALEQAILHDTILLKESGNSCRQKQLPRFSR